MGDLFIYINMETKSFIGGGGAEEEEEEVAKMEILMMLKTTSSNFDLALSHIQFSYWERINLWLPDLVIQFLNLLMVNNAKKSLIILAI